MTYALKSVLSIAGSDSSGGAGIQADIKTIEALGLFAQTAVTALTAQNTTGVAGVFESTPEFVRAQMDAVFADIRPDAVKIGMVSSGDLVRAIASGLRSHGAKNVVVDPVMVATSGSALMGEGVKGVLVSELFPLARVVTPNIPEAQVLTGAEICTPAQMEQAGRQLYESYGCAVLVKGGHSVNDANDLLWTRDGPTWFYGQRIRNPNTHGTGCTLSSAIASNLAKGYPLPQAIQRAKEYLSGALAAMLDLGQGRGPMDHAFDLNSPFGA